VATHLAGSSHGDDTLGVAAAVCEQLI